MRRAERALYERMLDERDRQIRILVAEIDWLRAQLGRPSLPAAITPRAVADGEEAVFTDGGWESESEEAQAILDAHGLSAVHLPEILEGLGYGSE